MPKRARKSKNAPAAKRKMSTPAAKKNARGNYSRQGRRVRRPQDALQRMPGLDPALRALRKLASGTGVRGAYLMLLPLAVVLRVHPRSPHLSPCLDCV